MKSQDIIEQLIGPCDGMDQQDTFAFTFYKPEKFPDYPTADIDFERGTLTLSKYGPMEDGHGDIVEEKKFSIKAILEPYEEPDDQENS